MTTRRGGVSARPWHSLNLGRSSGDAAGAVAANRAARGRSHRRDASLAAPGARRPRAAAWMPQRSTARRRPMPRGPTEPGVACTVHGGRLPAGAAGGAAGARRRRRARRLARPGRGRGRAHASTRCATARRASRATLVAWLGPCIGPDAVRGRRRRARGLRRRAARTRSSTRFRYQPRADGQPRWLADLPGLARDRLQSPACRGVSGGTWCTVERPLTVLLVPARRRHRPHGRRRLDPRG